MKYKTEFGPKRRLMFRDIAPGDFFRVADGLDPAPLMKTRVNGDDHSYGFVHLNEGSYCRPLDPQQFVTRIRIARVDPDGVPVFVDA